MKSELTAVSDAPLLPCIKGLFEDVAAEAEFWLLSGQKKKKKQDFPKPFRKQILGLSLKFWFHTILILMPLMPE